VNSLHSLTSDLRVRVRRDGSVPAVPRCVVYWMQRAQRARDNPALDTAVLAANALDLPLVVHFGLHPGYIAGVERA